MLFSYWLGVGSLAAEVFGGFFAKDGETRSSILLGDPSFNLGPLYGIFSFYTFGEPST